MQSAVTLDEKIFTNTRILYLGCFLAAVYGVAYLYSSSAVMLVVSVCVFVIFLALDEAASLYFMFFWFPFFTVLQIGKTYYYPYLLFLLFLKSVLYYRRKIRAELLLILATLFCLELLGFLQCSEYDFPELIKFLCGIAFAGQYLARKPQGYQQETALRYFFCGMLVECIVNILSMSNLVASTTYYGVSVDRQAVLGQDSNAGAMFCLVALWLCLAEISKTRKIKTSYFILFVTIMVCGLFSQSKTFLLLMIPTLAVFICLCCRSVKGISMLLVCVAVLLLIVANNKVLQLILASYISRFQRIDDVTSLTTGRSIVYKVYLERILSNPRTLMLGDGILSEQYFFVADTVGVVSSGEYLRPHSVLLEMLAGWGIFGSSLFVAFWVFTCRSGHQFRNRKQGKTWTSLLWRWAPFTAFFIFALSINVAYQPLSYVLFLLCMYHAQEIKENV